MSRTRDIWLARWTSVGLGYRPCKTIPAPADAPRPYAVTIKTELPDKDCRVVEVEMDPDSAESLGRSLIEYADKCRALNIKYTR